MKFFSAQYIFTNSAPPLKRGVICTEDDGTIISIENTGGALAERYSTEFHNGIIIPGFVNCHSHLELSWLKDQIPEKHGLSDFLMRVNSKRENLQIDINQSIIAADNEMFKEGVVLCADICNSSHTFGLKNASRIRYINLLEVFGIDPSKVGRRMQDIREVAEKAESMKLPFWIVPHALYSISLPLLRMIKATSVSNRITSVHNMESPDEMIFMKEKSGSLMESYRKFLPPLADFEMANDHISAILEEITISGNLILVHNTFIEKHHINLLSKRGNLYFCLCPNSNLFIENKLPPVMLLKEEGCEIVIGTDSLGSNRRLSILEELKTIQANFRYIDLETLIRWSTLNGAKALGEEKVFGTIEPGKKPGLVAINNIDLARFMLLPESKALRLI